MKNFALQRVNLWMGAFCQFKHTFKHECQIMYLTDKKDTDSEKPIQVQFFVQFPNISLLYAN